MADKKSCEGKLTTLECMECGFREVFTERQFKFTDGLSCLVCNGPVRPAITRPNDKIRNRRMKEFKKLDGNKTVSAGSLIITADASDAIKGLKGVQREARKATAALKELEEQQNKVPGFVSADDMYKEMECNNCFGRDFKTVEGRTDSGERVFLNITCKNCGCVQ